MKSLLNYVTEALDKPKKVSKTALKKMATDWIYSHVSGVRYKVAPGADGTFVVTCNNQKFGSKFSIEMDNNIPDFVRFDVKC